MRSLCFVATVLLVLAPEAFADPLLTASTTSIALSPTQTVITLSVDTDPDGPGGVSDTPIIGFVVDLRALTSGLQIISVVSLEPGPIVAFGPGPDGSDTIANFVGSFSPPPRSGLLDIGTVTVEGFVAGTPLVASGNWTDASFNDILFGPTDVATVIPEPGTAALIGVGFALLAALRRSSL